MEDRVDGVVEAIFAARPPEVLEWFDRYPELYDANVELARGSVRAEYACLREERLPDGCPEVDAAFARSAAQLSTPLNNLLWGYRQGHRQHWEAWYQLVGEQPVDERARDALLRRGWAFFFEYVDRLSEFVTLEYTLERDRMVRDQEQRRVQAVNAVLAGEPAQLPDYDTGGCHLGAIARGDDPGGAMRSLAAALDRRLLLVSVVDRVAWGWLGGPRALPDTARAALRRWSPPAGTTVALGDEAQGEDGFRLTHRQAAAAARGDRGGLNRYDDVALEALAAGSPDARAFVERELAGLAGDDPRSVKLRHTLAAYFAAGHNAAAAAAALGVHEQTVASRLRAVEERTGRAVATRRAELEVALRLRDWLES